ncbi:acyl carrier protein, partial [Paraburkholderia sp. SIMBA_061]
LISAELASILKMAENNITSEKVLRDIGLDSLMAMELGSSFQQKTGIDLPLSSISDNTTVGAIVGKLREKLLSRQPKDTNGDAVDDLL